MKFEMFEFIKSIKLRIWQSLLKWEYYDRKWELYRKQFRIKFIEEVLPKNGVGAELGVFKGHLSPMLLKHTKAEKLHLFDPWYLLRAKWTWANGNQSTVDALINVLRTFKRELENGRVLIHVGDDLQLLATFPDRYFDWVYLDTTHKYEQTMRELQLLANKVKDNGVIAGDDWEPDPNHIHHGVYKAVTEFVASSEYRVIYSDSADKQWAIRKS